MPCLKDLDIMDILKFIVVRRRFLKTLLFQWTDEELGGRFYREFPISGVKLFGNREFSKIFVNGFGTISFDDPQLGIVTESQESIQNFSRFHYSSRFQVILLDRTLLTFGEKQTSLQDD